MMNSLNGYSQSYINKFTNTMRSIFRAAMTDGIIIRNPVEMVHPPKGETGGHRVLEQWERELICTTWQGHDFGLCAMVMLFAGLRRGEALYVDIDRDVDFVRKILTVRGGLSFTEGNRARISPGKTKAAQRTIPLVDCLAEALKGHHGLLCPNEQGGYMSHQFFRRKYDSYITYLETCLNGTSKRWYGKTREHKALLAKGKPLPPWREINIRCHDFRVTFCTMCYEANIPVKTLQVWMGHSDAGLIMSVYAKLTAEKEQSDYLRLNDFLNAAPKSLKSQGFAVL